MIRRALALALGVLFLLSGTAVGAVQVNERVPIDQVVVIPCTGDTLTLEGDLHVLFTYTVNDNSVSAIEHFNPQGVTAVADPSGAMYRATGMTATSSRASLVNGAANFTWVNNFRMIGTAGAATYFVHEVVHTTVNADGTVTSDFSHVTIDCG
jgi:hypothetical protein